VVSRLALSLAACGLAIASVYDSARRRRTVSRGRERGCWVYVPAEELAKTAWRDERPPPFYRLWARTGGRTVTVQFFAEQ